jgi:hypothetical protein
MSGDYRVALRFAHGRVATLTRQGCAIVEYELNLPPTQEGLLKLLGELPPGLSGLTIVDLDCPLPNKTPHERAWGNIQASELQEALGVPVRRVSDIAELVRGITDREEHVTFPSVILILDDSDSGVGGFARKYLVTSPSEWTALPFHTEENAPIVLRVKTPSLLSLAPQCTLDLAYDCLMAHLDVRRLFVWSPEGLPVRDSTYSRYQAGGKSCSVTTIGDWNYVLNSALLS